VHCRLKFFTDGSNRAFGEKRSFAKLSAPVHRLFQSAKEGEQAILFTKGIQVLLAVDVAVTDAKAIIKPIQLSLHFSQYVVAIAVHLHFDNVFSGGVDF
jgi:hypothetical protein